jgi:arginase family enzyme
MSAPALTIYQGLAGDHNARAIGGARAMGTALEQRLGVTGSVVGTPAPVLNVHWDVELASARGALEGMATTIDRALAGGARPISAITRCAVALATVPAVVRHHPDACVVWFDAHADLHTPATSSSGYLGGMALAGAAGLWDSGLGSGPALPSVVLVGARDVDPPEQRLIDESGLRHVPAGSDLVARLREAVAGRRVYVHLDCDVLDAGIVPTDYAIAGGLTLAQLHEACAAIADVDVIGVEVAEFQDVWHDGGLPVSPAPVVAAIAPLLARCARSAARRVTP